MSDLSPEEMMAQQKANCIFCKIIAKEIPSQVAYEDDKFIGIMDIRPATKGHVLLMPKEHYPILPVIPGEVAQEMFVVARKLLNAVQKATLSFRANIFIANGGVAGQQSPHFLMHVMPREDNDKIPLDDLSVEGSVEEVQKIKSSLSSRFKTPAANPATVAKSSEPQTLEERDPISDLADALEQNPEVKQLIIEDPEKFKDYVKANPQLESLFQNIDINTLSDKLKSLEKVHSVRLEEAEKKDVEAVKENSEVEQETQKEVKEENVENEKKDEKKADLDKISKLFG